MTTPTPDLFEITVDSAGRNYLKDAARWAKFLAIAGFIFCALFLTFSLVSLTSDLRDLDRKAPAVASRYSRPYFISGLIPAYVGIALLYFFPCFFLLRFATRAEKALRDNDGHLLTRSFKSMRALYRFLGILLILGIIFFAVAFGFTLSEVNQVRAYTPR